MPGPGCNLTLCSGPSSVWEAFFFFLPDRVGWMAVLGLVTLFVAEWNEGRKEG